MSVRKEPTLRIILVPLFVLFGLLVGCASVDIELAKSDKAREFALDEFVDLWFLGMVGSPPAVPAEGLCPRSRLVRMTVEHSAEDLLLSLVTIGIYTPRTVRFWCEAPL